MGDLEVVRVDVEGLLGDELLQAPTLLLKLLEPLELVTAHTPVFVRPSVVGALSGCV
jgi:hypothetical protein